MYITQDNWKTRFWLKRKDANNRMEPVVNGAGFTFINSYSRDYTDGELFNAKDWVKLTHMIIDHGRTICIARRPKCRECVLTGLCPSEDI